MSDIELSNSSDHSFEDLPAECYDSEVHLEQEMCSFTPPLWQQRIEAIRSFIIQNGLYDIVDLGCGEGKLIEDLIPINGVKKVTGVDIDPNSLYKASEKSRPSACDYVMRRKYLLTVKFLQGDILRPSSLLPRHPQAIVLSEVIEHVQLEQVRPLTENLFGYLNPTYVIVSTPNKEFNVYFNLVDKLRIPDHKFEWTRAEFVQWCSEVCRDYDYEVQITGVGLNDGNNSYGFCTQIGIFTRKSVRDFIDVEESEYNEVYSVGYPVHQKRSFEDRFHYYLLRDMYAKAQNEELDEWVPIDTLKQNLRLTKISNKSGKDFVELLGIIGEKHKHHIQLSPDKRVVRLTPQDYEDQSEEEEF